MGQEQGAGSVAVPCRQDASHEDGATLTLPATSRILKSGMNFSGSGPALVVPPCPCDSQRCRVFAKHPLQQQVLLSSATRCKCSGLQSHRNLGKQFSPFPAACTDGHGTPLPPDGHCDPKSLAAPLAHDNFPLGSSSGWHKPPTH